MWSPHGPTTNLDNKNGFILIHSSLKIMTCLQRNKHSPFLTSTKHLWGGNLCILMQQTWLWIPLNPRFYYQKLMGLSKKVISLLFSPRINHVYFHNTRVPPGYVSGEVFWACPTGRPQAHAGEITHYSQLATERLGILRRGWRRNVCGSLLRLLPHDLNPDKQKLMDGWMDGWMDGMNIAHNRHVKMMHVAFLNMLQLCKIMCDSFMWCKTWARLRFQKTNVSMQWFWNSNIKIISQFFWIICKIIKTILHSEERRSLFWTEIL